jgi:hypothetical protein
MQARPEFLRFILWGFSLPALFLSTILLCQLWFPTFAGLVFVVGMLLLTPMLAFVGYRVARARPGERLSAVRLDMDSDICTACAWATVGTALALVDGYVTYIGVLFGVVGSCATILLLVRRLRMMMQKPIPGPLQRSPSPPA